MLTRTLRIQEAVVEQDRFDAFAVSLAGEGTSRRSVLGRLAASGVATALGITAITAFGDEEADAKKHKKRKGCVQKCNRKKKKNARNACKQKCKTASPTPAAGFPITLNTTLLGDVCTIGGTECGTNSGLECVAFICVPIDLGDVCVTGDDCGTGQCNGGVCSQCDMLNVCGAAGNQQCCVADADCVANNCVLPS